MTWLFFCLPANCFANIGVPMIFLTIPQMVIALLPIVLVEALLCMPYIKLSLNELIGGMFKANIVSTFIGIPVTWILLVILQMATGGGSSYGLSTPLQKLAAVTWQAPWLVPYESELYWMIPSASLVLLVPFYFASWFIEFKVAKRVFKSIEPKMLNRTIRNINFVSYNAMAAYVLIKWNLT